MQVLLEKTIFVHDSDYSILVKIFHPIAGEEMSEVPYSIESSHDHFTKTSHSLKGIDTLQALIAVIRIVGVRLQIYNRDLYLGRLCTYKEHWPETDPHFGFLPLNDSFNIYLKDKAYL